MNETLLAETFVAAADTLVSDFDVVDFLSVLAGRCVELFDAGDAGFMLSDSAGRLQVVASSSHQMRLLELFELQHDEGPCLEAYQQGHRIEATDLRDETRRWPQFGREALDQGFGSAYAFPMRLREETIGAFNLIRTEPGALLAPELAAAQALTDVATIGILHHRASRETQLRSEQLQYALDSRIVIEQAKGVIREQNGIDVDAAFALLRAFSRDRNRRLIDVATEIVNRTLTASDLTLIGTPDHDRTNPRTD